MNYETLDNRSYEELLEIIRRLEARVAELERENQALKEENKRLKQELAAEKRKNNKQATPFAKKKRKAKPKRPGRKPGQGTFRTRQEPEPTEPLVQVPVEETRCPDCGGKLVYMRTDRATVTEIPETLKPKVTPYDVEVRTCQACGKTVRGKNPALAEDQLGASAHRFGPRAMATAHILHYGVGVTVRKTPEVLKLMAGLDITPSAITQDALRKMRGPVGEAYRQLRDSVRQSPNVHTDDTGWKVGGDSAHLMVFETTGEKPVTVFQIRRQHRNEEVREVVPADYQGTMTTDRGPSYDAEELRGVKQNKCVAHVKRNISQTQETQPPGARSFGNSLKKLIDDANDLWREYGDDKITRQKYEERAGPLRDQRDHLLRDRELSDPGNQRLLDGLGMHADLGNLLRFLDDPSIEPTNNRAERALRPAVIARKVSQCSKTAAGAEAHAGFLSVLCTLARRSKELVEDVVSLFRGANPLAA